MGTVIPIVAIRKDDLEKHFSKSEKLNCLIHDISGFFYFTRPNPNSTLQQ